MITEQEARILKSSYKILDYKLGDIDYQLEALARQTKVNEEIKEREGQILLDRTRIVAHLKSGGEFEIDINNRVEVELFVNLRKDGLINIFEPKRNKFIAVWEAK